MSGAHDTPVSNQNLAAGPTLRWVLRRTALGVVILMVAVTTAACLLYAGIEPDRAEASPDFVHQDAQLPTGSLFAKGN